MIHLLFLSIPNTPFGWFVIGHIATGLVGLLSFWIPVLAKKGGEAHRKVGLLFAHALLATGCFAVGISLCSLIDPLGTHPNLHDVAMIRGLFGWMMLYLATLTVSLAWYGRLCIVNKRQHAANRNPFNVGLQVATILVAVNCAVQGWLIGQPLMMLMPIIGVASGVTNLWFIATDKPARQAYLKEHAKAITGAGISAYTAFLSVGLVQVFPQHAFNPAIWATPTVLGISFIYYHHRRIDGGARARRAV